MRAVFVLGLLCLAPAALSQQPSESQGDQKRPQAHDRRSQGAMPVRPVAPESSNGLTTQTAQDHGERAAEDAIVKLTRYLVAVGFLQLVVFAVQARRLRQSVDESRKSTATIRDNAERQLRAYVTVGTGALVDQNLATSTRLEWRPSIVNTGLTPAHDVEIAARVEVLNSPLDADMDFSVPQEIELSRGTIAAHQTYVAAYSLDRLLTDAEIQEIRERKKKAFYIYGSVTYRDVFKVRHSTNFCQFAVWDRAGNLVAGYLTDRHNDAD